MTETNRIIRVENREFGSDKYTGDWDSSNGRPHGHGTYTYKNGDIYDGNFVNGKREGYGKLFLKNGYEYDGSFINGDPEYGTLTQKTGDKYVGGFINWKREGYGKLFLKNGDIYDGSFINGDPNGYGTLTTKDWIYYGNFVNGKREGHGTLTYKDGGKYVGFFKNDEFHGHGELLWGNGDKYDGDFVNGKREGHGTYTYKDGERYDGEFVNNNFEGHGTYTWKSGNRYDGDFVNNNFEGHGTLTYKDGERYVGYFKDNKQFGKGELTVVNIKTKEHLYVQIYDENGIMSGVKYLFKDKEGNPSEVVIDYRGINVDLNKGLIKNPDDLKNYTGGVDFETIKELAKYQMRARSVLNDDGSITDGKDIVDGGRTGLQSLIILSELGDDIEAMKNVSFEIEENRPDWPIKIYKDDESLFNSVNLTSINKEGYTPIDKTAKKIIALPVVTTAKNHEVAIIVVPKIEDDKPITFSFYIFDSSRAITYIPEKSGNLGNIKGYFCNHPQQNHGCCWLNTVCTIIAAAKHPEIFNKGIKLEDGKLNDLQILQILTLQGTVCNLGVEKISIDNLDKRMIHHIVNEDVRNLIKNEVKEKYMHDPTILSNLGISKWGTYVSTLIVAEKRELLNEHDVDENKTAEKLKEMDIKDFDEVDQGLLNIFKEIKESKNTAIDEELLLKANDELKSLTDNTKIELLKRVNKKIEKEL